MTPAEQRPRCAPLPPTLAWHGDASGTLELLDQTQLPGTYAVLQTRTLDAVAVAIQRLCVRGAPAIGVAAAYGLWLGVRAQLPHSKDVQATARDAAARLAATRPTAVNLRWALQRCLLALQRHGDPLALFHEAQAIHREDIAACTAIGAAGWELVPDGGTVLTHCNTGALATTGSGTALAVLFAAWQRGRRFRVLADETRPLLQGARLTALELLAAGIPVQLLCDGAAAGLLARGEVQMVIVGADRIAANGDFANKVGTYGLALAAKAHGVPFYTAAPLSTFDANIASGGDIPIEERDAAEVLECGGHSTAPTGVSARNPAFDVTPANLLQGIITDRGLLRPPFAAAIKRVLANDR
jgi:methylthioribose-1-phosphate isomerase